MTPVVISFSAFPIETAPKDRLIMLFQKGWGWGKGYWSGFRCWASAGGAIPNPEKITHWAEIEDMQVKDV